MLDRRSRIIWGGAAAVVLLLCVPLFLGLEGRDQHNDEASYSYGAQRILETGDWLHIHGAPDDVEFLEKPPLKFWVVAAAMKSGVLPQTDTGFRLIDVIAGSVTLLYLYFFGVRIRGVVAGMAAAFMLFAFLPYVNEHGIRSDNMESFVVLAYVGAFYHVLRWRDAAASSARGHAYAAVLLFVLGFLTKFVVMVFVPAGAVLLLLWRRDLSLVRRRGREWIGPAAVFLVLCAPWFIYKSIEQPRRFWDVLVASQVLQRITTGLDPSHLQPWWFYPRELWIHYGEFSGQWIVAAGLLVVVVRAARGNAVAGLIAFWGIVPLTAISLSTSKILHYLYPFVPPLALAAGWLFADVVAAVRRRLLPADARSPLLALAGGLAIALAVATFWSSEINLTVFGIRASNGSIWRPLVFAALALTAASRSWRGAAAVPALAVLLFGLPMAAYEAVLDETRVAIHPLRTLQECVRVTTRTASTLLGSGRPPTHAFFFYLRPLGSYVEPPENPAPDAAITAKATSTAPAMVLLSQERYGDWLSRHSGSEGFVAVAAEDGWALVFSPALQPCVTPTVNAGGKYFGTARQPEIR